MRYYIGMCGKKYKIASFDGEREELVDLATLEKLTERGDLIGGDWEKGLWFVSKYSSYTVADNKVDSHYIKNNVLKCELDFRYNLMHKFYVDIYFEAVTKDLTYITYRLIFGRKTDMQLVITCLHEMQLVNFDYLSYKTSEDNLQYAFIRIKLSVNYTNAVINELAKVMKVIDESGIGTQQLIVTERYSGLILELATDCISCCWSTIEERCDTRLRSPNNTIK